jgi:hypothetical protein
MFRRRKAKIERDSQPVSLLSEIACNIVKPFLLLGCWVRKGIFPSIVSSRFYQSTLSIKLPGTEDILSARG